MAFTLSRKIIAAFIGIIAIILVSSLISWIENNRVEYRADQAFQAYERTVALREVQMMALDMTSLTRGVVITGNEYLMGIYNDLTAAFPGQADYLISLYGNDDPEGRVLAEDLKASVIALQREVYDKQMERMRDPARHAEAIEVETSGSGWPFLEKVLVSVDTATQREREIIEREKAAVAAVYDQHQYVLIGIPVLSLIVVLIIVVWTQRSITEPLQKIISVLLALAKKDYSVEASFKDRGDEIGDMSRAIEVFRSEMADAERLAREQQNENAVKLKRAQAVDELIRAFDADIHAVVKAMAEAQNSLKTSAGTMNEVANRGRDYSGVVANSAVEADSNIQTVSQAVSKLSEQSTVLNARINAFLTGLKQL